VGMLWFSHVSGLYWLPSAASKGVCASISATVGDYDDLPSSSGSLALLVPVLRLFRSCGAATDGNRVKHTLKRD
jgi:hypothetical protein